jgi:hypothetical protein
LPFPSRSPDFLGVNPVAPNLATAPEGVAGHRDLARTKSNSPRGRPCAERVGIIGVSALPPAPPYPISQGAIVRSPPQALRYSVVSVSQERQPALTPLHRSVRICRGRQRAQRGGLRRSFACAILCARKGDCDEFGERAAMARRSREGKTVHQTPAGRHGAGRLRRWTSGPGSRGRTSHAGIDYGLTMSCTGEARPWVGQPGK